MGVEATGQGGEERGVAVGIVVSGADEHLAGAQARAEMGIGWHVPGQMIGVETRGVFAGLRQFGRIDVPGQQGQPVVDGCDQLAYCLLAIAVIGLQIVGDRYGCAEVDFDLAAKELGRGIGQARRDDFWRSGACLLYTSDAADE